MRGCRNTVGNLIEFVRLKQKLSWASVYWYMHEQTEGYGFIEFEISNGYCFNSIPPTSQEEPVAPRRSGTCQPRCRRTWAGRSAASGDFNVFTVLRERGGERERDDLIYSNAATSFWKCYVQPYVDLSCSQDRESFALRLVKQIKSCKKHV